jgi:hypothetical protein
MNQSIVDELTNESTRLCLEKDLIKKGLRTLGMHPLAMRHALLELVLTNEKLEDISILKDYVYLVYINLNYNQLRSLKVLENIPALVQLRAR